MLNRQYDGYMNCPYCGKIIKDDATQCVHCNKGLSKKINNKKTKVNYGIGDFIEEHKILFLFLFLIFLYFFTHSGYYRITHLFPTVSSTAEKLVPPYNAVQINLNPIKEIQVGNGDKQRTLTLQAQYSLTGVVVAKNIYFRFINRRDFDDVVPIDIGMVWGDIADVDYLKKHFTFVSETAWSARWLRAKTKDIPYTEDMNKFITHNHIIPANDNVASALLSLKKWDIARLDGYLVDITHPDGTRSFTSLTRTDGNHEERAGMKPGDGMGACEIIYVTGVQIGDKYYK